MTQTQKKLRYPIGSKSFFIWIDYTRGFPRFGSLFLPWADTLNNISIKALTCVEHHKVSWDQDPTDEKVYDGFVFTEEKPEYTSGKWFNQYPRASYGQMDDSHNWKVTPDQTEAEINSLPDNKVWATYQDVTVFLGSALRGALNLKEEGKLVESKALSDFYDKVVKLLKDDFKMEVCASTMKLERKDGSTEEIPGLFDIELKPIT